VVFKPEEEYENGGTEDPRVAYRELTGEYYLLYTAVQQLPESGEVMARLALATTLQPSNSSREAWTRYGPLFNQSLWTKSGALLIRDGYPGPHYLIYGDSSLVPGLQIASSPNLINYTTLPELFLEVRNQSFFDSKLVESGPPPMLLSDGNYLFLYNSARVDTNSSNGLQYNIGWCIINGTDPTQVVARSNVPLLSPELSWEISGLTPNVVFVEGMEQAATNSFVFFYGAADTAIGAALVTVEIGGNK